MIYFLTKPGHAEGRKVQRHSAEGPARRTVPDPACEYLLFENLESALKMLPLFDQGLREHLGVMII